MDYTSNAGRLSNVHKFPSEENLKNWTKYFSKISLKGWESYKGSKKITGLRSERGRKPREGSLAFGAVIALGAFANPEDAAEKLGNIFDNICR